MIWEFNAGAFAVSTDGRKQTWNSGVTADGSIVTKIIETTKIVSDVKSELDARGRSERCSPKLQRSI